MELKYKIFPYPVLASYLDDYQNSEFQVDIKHGKNGQYITFSISYQINNKKINQMIENGTLKVIAHFECSKTTFRNIYDINEVKKISIKESKLSGKLQICTFLICNKQIKGYSNEDFDEDFKGMTFDFDEGNILAIGNQIDFNIEKNKDEFLNTESIFSIQKNVDSKETHMLIDLDMNKICIKLPSETFYIYKNLCNQYQLRSLLNSLVILPTLLYVLEELSKIDGDDRYNTYSMYGWYNSLKKILMENFEINLESSLFSKQNMCKIAQDLIDCPVTESFIRLSTSFDLVEEDLS